MRSELSYSTRTKQYKFVLLHGVKSEEGLGDVRKEILHSGGANFAINSFYYPRTVQSNYTRIY